MPTETFAIIGDAQVPYHDPAALDVAGQILADVKPDLLIYNGDWADFRKAGRHPQSNKDERLIAELRTEIQIARERLHTWHKAVKPKKAKFTSGNHEWRLERMLTRDTFTAQLLEIAEIGEALSVETLFQLKKAGIQYVGQYPRGCWLKDGLAPEENVWVEHGMTARIKGGYTVSGVMEKRWSSAIVNHCEKLAGPIWARKLGRDFFGIENGNLSLIAEPGKGDDIYTGIPHSTPEFMDHRQGFSVVYRDSGQWFPFTVKVRDGKAFWGSKLYRA